MIKSNDLITSLEASQILGFSQAHIRRLVAQKKIKAEKYGACWLIRRSALNAVKRKHKEETHGSDQ